MPYNGISYEGLTEMQYKEGALVNTKIILMIIS